MATSKLDQKFLANPWLTNYALIVMIQGPASQMLFGANHELNFYPGLFDFIISKASFC